MNNPFFLITFLYKKSMIVFFLNNFSSYEEFEKCLSNIIYYHAKWYKRSESDCLSLKLQFFIDSKIIEILFLYPYVDKSISYKDLYNIYSLNPKTVNNIFKTGKSFDGYIYEFNIKDTRIWIYNNNNQLIRILNN